MENSNMKNAELTIEVKSIGLDEIIEKAERLLVLLKQINEQIELLDLDNKQ